MKFMPKAALLMTWGLSLTVLAHTPYLKPLSFEPQRANTVTLDASFAERFFVPEAAISHAPFEVIGPDGAKQAVDTVVNLESRNVLEHKLSEDGTYKFSTGHRYGPIFRTYELNGERGSIRGEDKPLPEGATLIAMFKPVTNAVTYVSKKAPTNGALVPSQSGLEVILGTHPNSLFAKEAVNLRVYLDGKPLGKQPVTIYQAKDQFSEESDHLTIQTDSDGNALFTPNHSGLYLLQTRLRADAPSGSDVPQYSYTTTLTVEVY